MKRSPFVGLLLRFPMGLSPRRALDSSLFQEKGEERHRGDLPIRHVLHKRSPSFLTATSENPVLSCSTTLRMTPRRRCCSTCCRLLTILVFISSKGIQSLSFRPPNSWHQNVENYQQLEADLGRQVTGPGGWADPDIAWSGRAGASFHCLSGLCTVDHGIIASGAA
ncbi:hypothetical protein T4B_36 [Trichinella pseudospiralis]|uniref:Uncharacterized protein n=1 Tax=Trichinella pseudospiralis TaxID=6337 RepID=A0A0V1K5Q7_TRIPS|nr:hypothetical protein T4A_4989 [Trichinella pseudospiralis]KRZ33936.1 hypothetical protein T4B_36 [Trichinella pseudospiralis]KRZ42590.1 hypothetical protein T4C_12185 [Trichinella pseudospiralis]